MPSNYLKADPVFGQIDLDDEYIQDSFLIDRYTGSHLYGYGNNFSGQLGLGDVISRSSMVQIGSNNNWATLRVGSPGQNYSMFAIKNDGTLWSWGTNHDGRLGLGDKISRSSPVQVGSLTNWKIIQAGRYGVHAIKTDGTLWSWGGQSGYSGALGLQNTIDYSSPVQVGLLNDWKLIAGGNYSAVAIKNDGSLWVWGDGYLGGSVFNDIIERSSPTQLIGSTWRLIGASGYYAVGVKSDDSIWHWGYTDLFTTGLSSSPTQIGSLSGWKIFNCGHYHLAAIKFDGTLWGWGWNWTGCLGTGNTIDYRSSPVQVGLLTDWKTLACGKYFTTAVKTNGTLWAWGSYFSNTNWSSPIQIGSLTNWKDVSTTGANIFGLTLS